MQKQLGREPDPDKCPPGPEDFPEIVAVAMTIFQQLGNRVYPDVGYIGKDYTNFEFLLKNYKIQKHQKDFVSETVLWLDSRAIEISQKKLKAEYDRIKRRN